MVRKRLVWVVAGMLGCVGFGAAPARGALMTFAFEGVVDEVVDWSQVLTQYVQIGDTLSGTATIDLSVPDLWPDADYAGKYDGAVVGVTGQVGDMTFVLDMAGTSKVTIANDAPPLDSSFPGPWDEYEQGADVRTPVVDYALVFGISLLDLAGTAFDASMGDSLPTMMPPLDAFQPFPGDDQGFILSNGASITGKLTSLSTVPEPGTISMLLLGGGIVAVRGRYRAR